MADPINRNGARGVGGPKPRVETPAERGKEPTDLQNKPLDKGKALDAQRLLSRAGFVRQPGTGEGKLNLGDYGRAAIPLDPGDVDAEAWDPNALAAFSQHLTLKSAKLKEIARRVAEGETFSAALTAGLLGRADLALRRWRRRGAGDAGEGADAPPVLGDDGDATLGGEVQAAAASDSSGAAHTPAQVDIAELVGHLAQLFNVQAGEGQEDLGEIVLAAALVVAGKSDNVQSSGAGEMDAAALLEGLKLALDEGRIAVQQFEQMHSKINRQVNVHRTFMFKR